jgi:branched-chain amino acid transport system substrate-binding protein
VGWPARRAQLARIALVALVVPACRGPQRPAPSWRPGEHHVTAGEPDRAPARPALDRAELERRFAVAQAAADGPAMLVYANQLATLGHSVGQSWPPVIDEVPVQDLQRIWPDLDPAHEPAGWVALRLGLAAAHVGDQRQALAWLDRVAAATSAAGSADAEQARPRAAALAARLRAGEQADPAVVAVLAPLSGAYRRLGEEVRLASELAFAGDPAAKVVFVDTAGTEEGAVAAVDAALARHRALAVVGPIGQRESAAAAARAVELGLPIALLAPAKGGGAPDVGVFRLWASAYDLAGAAARAAVARGYNALAVFAPRDEQGREESAGFRDAARAEGAQVVAYGTYDPSTAHLEQDVKRLLNLDPARNPRLRQHLARQRRRDAWKTFSPDVPFDLLFIPDTYQRAAFVLAYLPYFNVELRTGEHVDPLALRAKHGGRIPSLVQLMGSSGWRAEGMIPRAGGIAEGALVVGVCSGGVGGEYPSDVAAQFAQAYERRRGHPPTATAAQAYDAMRMVLHARRAAASAAAGARRAAFIKALGRAGLNDGACGPVRVAPSGEVVRDPVILRIEGDEFIVEEF